MTIAVKPLSLDIDDPAGWIRLAGDLAVPEQANGVVLFAHGSGSSRHSPRNRAVAEALQDRGSATLLLDLLTDDEERLDQRTRELRFDIGLLTGRLVAAVDRLGNRDETSRLPIGLFGASTGAAAALMTAAERTGAVSAVVSRGGRPDLADRLLPAVEAPSLFIVGGRDEQVLELNRRAMRAMSAPNRLEIVPHATHLFEEPGALEQVSRLAADWFEEHLASS